MEFKTKSERVLRGALADAEDSEEITLIKNTSMLMATYQIRILLFQALQKGKILTLIVPENCQFDSDLMDIVKKYKNSIKVEHF